MISIYVPEKNDRSPFEIFVNNEKRLVESVDGRTLLGDLAPFWLNPVQTAFFSHYRGKNTIISTPTGSGKTAIAFLAAFQKGKRVKKTLYVAPTRALARQIFQDIRTKPLKVYLRTGESKMDVKDDYDMVIATPEAFLAARHSNSPWVQSIEFVIIDETHMLMQDTRGIVYEETLVQLLGDRRELLLLSATIPDTLSLAEWVNADLLIESSWRPIPLERAFLNLALPTRKNAKTSIQQMKQAFLEENIEQRVKTMIIVPSKKTGWDLLSAFERPGYRAMNDTVPYIKPKLVGEPVVAFHNADIPVEEKKEIEAAFKSLDNGLSILISTQTLAYGFNSPADDIVIFVKYSLYQEEKIWPVLIDLLQFEGRAGRKGYTKRGVGRVFYATGTTGEKTAAILKALLKRGLADVFETTLDKAFTALNDLYTRHESIFHPDNETKLLGMVELFSLGVLSVNEEHFNYTHFKGRFKERIIQKAVSRLREIGMVEGDNRLTRLGNLTASYLLNPEAVAHFVKNVTRYDVQEDPSSFWTLWESIALLVPGGGAVPDYYPPFFPPIGGHWNRQSVFFSSYAGLLQFGLGFLWNRLGIEQDENDQEGRRQKPPAWVGSLPYDVELICSFYEQGARYGFWDLCPSGVLERIRRSLTYGISPLYSLLTKIPGIGSLRANIVAYVGDFHRFRTDLEWVRRLTQKTPPERALWEPFLPFLRTYYRVQLEWLKKSVGISGDVSIDHLIELDQANFFSAVELIREYLADPEKSKTWAETPQPIWETSPLDAFKEEVKVRYPDLSLVFFVEEEGKDQLMNQVPFRLCDRSGQEKVYGTVYQAGRLPSQAVLRFQELTQRRIHTDYVDTLWEEGM
jgi:superfamily II DNA/RNA helicase